MVKLLFLCRRRPDITHERYTSLLLEGHVPLALRHHPTLRRYAVNVVEETLGAAPPLDSIGALWFDRLEDFEQRLYDSPEGERIIARDVGRFLGGAETLVVREETLHEPPRALRLGVPTAGTKLVLCLPTAGAVRELLSLSGVCGLIVDYLERRLDGAPPPCAAIAELYLDDGAPLPAPLPEPADAYRVAEYVER